MTECIPNRAPIAVLFAAVAFGIVAPMAAQDIPDPEAELPELPSGPVEEAPAEPQPEAPLLPDARNAEADQLETLYAELSEPGNRRWRQTEEAIWRAWSRSGSASMDLLLRRADKAAQAGDLDLALRFLNDLVRLDPGFAEGWNKRATLFFMQRKLGRAVVDIRRTLALEPRHFGALTGLAVILEETGDEAGALRAWRRAAEIHPNLEGAAEAIERLSLEVEGRPL